MRSLLRPLASLLIVLLVTAGIVDQWIFRPGYQTPDGGPAVKENR